MATSAQVTVDGRTHAGSGPAGFARRVVAAFAGEGRASTLTGALLRGSGAAALISFMGTGAAFLMQLVLARLLGVHDYGLYSLAIAWLAIALIFAKAGFDTAVVKFLPAHALREEWPEAAVLVRAARRAVLVLGAAAGIGVAIAFARGRVEPGTWLVAGLLVILLPLCAYSELNAAVLRGLKRIAAGVSGDALLRPLVVIAGAFVAWLVDVRLGTSGALALYLVGTAASIGWSSWFLRRSAVETAKPLDVRPQWSAWLGTSIPLMLANGFLTLMYSVDTVMVGELGSPADAGVYSVCTRLAIVILFAMNAAQLAAAPLIAEAAAGPSRETLQSLVRVFNATAAVVALPITAAVLAFPVPVLELFGAEFAASGAEVLRLLAVMQLLNVLTGPVGVVLGMLGEQRALAALIASGLVLNVGLNLLWIPTHGGLGAAWSALVAHTAWNVVGAVWIARRLRVDCTVLSLLRGRRGTGAAP